MLAAPESHPPLAISAMSCAWAAAVAAAAAACLASRSLNWLIFSWIFSLAAATAAFGPHTLQVPEPRRISTLAPVSACSCFTVAPLGPITSPVAPPSSMVSQISPFFSSGSRATNLSTNVFPIATCSWVPISLMIDGMPGIVPRWISTLAPDFSWICLMFTPPLPTTAPMSVSWTLTSSSQECFNRVLLAKAAALTTASLVPEMCSFLLGLSMSKRAPDSSCS
mmetsp:Transcript_32247/g.39022  ORF Transcript_32247/g.39022 Transcript_32247/m.39022 type:complete len:223 (-) Transcript_32247:710-1378(-)